MFVESLGELVDRFAADDRAALVVDDRSISYAELARNVRRAAYAVKEKGIEPGDRVAVIANAGDVVASTVLGAARIGAVAALINPVLTPREIDELCTAAGTKLTVEGPLDSAEEIKEATRHDEAVVLFTSGTTGKPKPIPVPTDTLLARLEPYADPPKTQTRLLAVPTAHVGGLIGLLVGLAGGHRTVVQRKFDSGAWLRAVEKYGVEVTFLVPTMLRRILDHPDFKTADLSSLTSLACGAAPLPPELADRFLTAWPHVALVNTFGQTETLGGITASTSDDARHPVRRNSVGRLLPGIEARVVKTGTDEELPANAVGELCVRSAQNVRNGWLRTGDLVRIDADGYVYPAGRVTDTINRGGEKIEPVEVENVLREHPAVSDVAVAGVPDEQMGQRVGAAIVGDVAADELRDWCGQRLARHKLPQVVAYVDAVPVTELGKVDRKAVTALLAQAAERV